jgi:hypothetical protein
MAHRSSKESRKIAIKRVSVRRWKKRRLMPRLLLDTNVIVQFLTGDASQDSCP